MEISAQIAKQIRAVYLGGNWTGSNFKDLLNGLQWHEANQQVNHFNSITTLVFHTYYYIGVVNKVLQGGPLEGKDELSFQHPAINSQEQWETLLNQMFADVETLAILVEELPSQKLLADFADPKYGTYYRNLHGIIEHAHYHLGQISLIKKLIQAANK